MNWFTELVVQIAAVIFIGDNILTSVIRFLEEQKHGDR